MHAFLQLKRYSILPIHIECIFVWRSWFFSQTLVIGNIYELSEYYQDMIAYKILLAVLIICLLLFLIYIALKPKIFSKRKILLIVTFFSMAIVSLFFFTGFKKFNSDISRILRNSSPKTHNEVYSLLFKKPIDSCMTPINFKDQLIPKIDCCIWMEVKLCPTELTRIIKMKNYKTSIYSRLDSLNLLKPFSDKPVWWTPQVLGDTIIKLNIRFNDDNQQTLFFGRDSSHVYLCDQAL